MLVDLCLIETAILGYLLIRKGCGVDGVLVPDENIGFGEGLWPEFSDLTVRMAKVDQSKNRLDNCQYVQGVIENHPSHCDNKKKEYCMFDPKFSYII